MRRVRELPSRSNSRSCNTRSKLGLEFERNLANLVEKNRASVRQFKAPDSLRHCPGERAFLVTEHFALQKAHRNRGAVQLHERMGASLAAFMNGARHEFLARSGFTQQEHGRIAGSHGFHLTQDRPDRRAVADDVGKIHLAANLGFQIQLLLRQFVLQIGDLAVGQRVIHSDRYLVRDLRKKSDFVLGEGGPPRSTQVERSQNLPVADQWQ